MENEPKIDFLETLKAMNEQFINDFYAKQQKMLELAVHLDGLKPYIEAASQNMLKMNIDDQILILDLTVKQAELCKKLCEKYGLEPEEENDNGEI